MIARAADIAGGYSTRVTLRQLFYRLVAEELLPNTMSACKTLSRLSADARRFDGFPALLDQGRSLWIPASWDTAADLLRYDLQVFRHDRTEGQEHAVVIGVEKATVLEQLKSWFGGYGVPIVALRGYSSQTIEREVIDGCSGSPVLIYAGDYDPSGDDILRNFCHQTILCDWTVRQVALTADQVAEYGLPEAPGKASDTRAGGFIAAHG